MAAQKFLCRTCGEEVNSKKWGFATLCEICDTPESTNKSMAILIADGKTDYHFQIIPNPTDVEAATIKSIGRAWDPRSQLKAINKVSS